MTSRLLPALLLSSAFAVLAGCATPTIVTLNDGREIQAVDTPRYDRSSGFYELEQLDGKRTRVNKDQVRSIKDM
ncbi:TPA: YgdI/YgdR family lipoprotein [Pseudomonas aeruginosa]|uniref:YgdI/YgdR family lipoprotein n=1 Tax=Pseudomonas aeruginosa TaxID=287 RepID=UPI00066E9EF3|nr:YgdI/YgdR family lipoprotein [Pseudomonas aeruginosa]ELK4875976.1 YgdI/YgdR family lipoprotein [Pseudomonas aeruginosa]MBG4157576.1 YgdI/YgdR family lipoprotein [Pseudomonas aeruginosa]MBG4169615.1 YgdI/YgdR family lipoprotein [Pseudomonas aeruginosa]MBG4489477.1 YgdI/YgdR family lipoprotein [Pseudomonas aeruginosa]MBG4501699.1 YgdI/YgdR family lipoprotein [Pseudomonas aeruginosa]